MTTTWIKEAEYTETVTFAVFYVNTKIHTTYQGLNRKMSKL